MRTPSLGRVLLEQEIEPLAPGEICPERDFEHEDWEWGREYSACTDEFVTLEEIREADQPKLSAWERIMGMFHV